MSDIVSTLLALVDRFGWPGVLIMAALWFSYDFIPDAAVKAALVDEQVTALADALDACAATVRELEMVTTRLHIIHELEDKHK